MAKVNTRKRGQYWQYQFEVAKVDGKRKQESKSGFKTQKEALAAGIEALNTYNNSGQVFKPNEISVSDYLDLWLEQYCKVNLTQTTYENYKKRIRLYIKPEIGKYKLNSITTGTIQLIINKMFNDGFSRNTLSIVKGILVSSFDYATNTLKYISNNPASPVKLPLSRAIPDKATRKKERVVLSDGFIKKLFDRFPYGHSAYIELCLGYSCGLRLGEAFAIDLEKDLDLENNYLFVNYQIQMLNGYWTLVDPKYQSRRKIKLDEFTTNILKQCKDEHFKSISNYGEYYKQLLINSKNQLNYKDGTPIHLLSTREDGSYIQPRIMQHVGRVVHYDLYDEKDNINKEEFEKYDFHSLRHTHSTKLLQAGANPKDIQIRLGHKNIQTTLQIYTHTTEIIEQETANIFEDINVLKK